VEVERLDSRGGGEGESRKQQEIVPLSVMRAIPLFLALLGVVTSDSRADVASRPPIGQEATVGPGEVLYSETRTPRTETERQVGTLAKLGADMTVTKKGEVLPKGTVLRYYPPTPPGYYPPAGAIGRLPLYCSEKHTVNASTASVLLGGPSWKSFLCLQDSKQNSRFDVIVLRGHRLPDRIVATPYEVVPEMVREVHKSDPFTMDLLYQGAGGGILRLSYREYSANLARPAFQQDATFDLNKDGSPTRLLFKGAEFEVYEAGNMGIRYRVLAPFK